MVRVRVSCLRSAHRGQARQCPRSRDLYTQGVLNRFIDVGATFRELPVFSVCPLMGLEMKTPPRNRRHDLCRRPPIASEGLWDLLILQNGAHAPLDHSLRPYITLSGTPNAAETNELRKTLNVFTFRRWLFHVTSALRLIAVPILCATKGVGLLSEADGFGFLGPVSQGRVKPRTSEGIAGPCTTARATASSQLGFSPRCPGQWAGGGGGDRSPAAAGNVIFCGNCETETAVIAGAEREGEKKPGGAVATSAWPVDKNQSKEWFTRVCTSERPSGDFDNPLRWPRRPLPSQPLPSPGSHAAQWCLSTSSSFCLQVLVGGGITSYWSGLETRSPVWRSLGCQPDPQFGAAWGANQIPQSGEAWGANPIPSLEKPGAVTGSPFGEAWGANRIPSLGQPGVPVKDTLAAITSWPPHFSGFAHPEFVFRSVAPSRRKVGGFSSRGTEGPGCSCLWLRHPPAALCSQLAGRAEPGGAGVGGFYEQLGFHLHSVTWPHLTARDAGRGGRRKRKGGGGQPADRPRTRRPRDCLRDTVRHPWADEHANLTAAPPAPRCRELRSLGSPLLPSLSEPRLQRLRRRASRPPTPHPRGAAGGGAFRVPGTNRPGKKLQNGGAV
ncbi:uncharacterized protein LOC122207761 [Panthera leo]|uniref:uncharacterized protein LOC122207761 n=1 Tax=Panthera leo TaxID=9689 RepID=UPI001C69F260|nr:uncharacterized protein LOC122207761 [Panthera leo]